MFSSYLFHGKFVYDLKEKKEEEEEFWEEEEVWVCLKLSSAKNKLFTRRFWVKLFQVHGSNPHFSLIFHP